MCGLVMFSTAYPCMNSWRLTLNESADFYLKTRKKSWFYVLRFADIGEKNPIKNSEYW